MKEKPGRLTPRGVLDYAEIGKVLDSVRSAGEEVPVSFYPAVDVVTWPLAARAKELQSVRDKRAKLARDIAAAFSLRNSLPGYTNDAHAVMGAKALERLRREAQSLVGLLEDDDCRLCSDIAAHMGPPSHDSPGIGVTLNGLKEIVVAAGKELDRRRSVGLDKKAILNLEISPPQPSGPNRKKQRAWIAGWNSPENRISRSVSDSLPIELGKAFKRHLNLDPRKFTYLEGEPNGGAFYMFYCTVIDITNEWRRSPEDGGRIEKKLAAGALQKALQGRQSSSGQKQRGS